MVHEKPSLPDVPTAEPPRPAAAATLDETRRALYAILAD